MSQTLLTPATPRPIVRPGPGPTRPTRPTRPASRALSPAPGRSAARSAWVAAGYPLVSCARTSGADAHSSAVHLTRRGWIFLLATAVVLAGALLGVGHVMAGRQQTPIVATAPAQVVVAPGDTLWSIATAAAPQRDPREVVFDIRRRNHLGSAALVPGQVLQLS